MINTMPTTTSNTLILTTLLAFFICNCSNDKKADPTPDALNTLLQRAVLSDSFELDRAEPFLHFHSGHLLSQTAKHALSVDCGTDSTYTIRLFRVTKGQAILIDSIAGPEAFPVQFRTVFQDYNFDGQTDLYIQVSASNGYSLSRGHLLVFDPVTQKFVWHKEARQLANMRPDPKTKTVASEDVLWCADSGQIEVCLWASQWINGLLKTIKKECPCEPE